MNNILNKYHLTGQIWSNPTCGGDIDAGSGCYDTLQEAIDASEGMDVAAISYKGKNVWFDGDFISDECKICGSTDYVGHGQSICIICDNDDKIEFIDKLEKLMPLAFVYMMNSSGYMQIVLTTEEIAEKYDAYIERNYWYLGDWRNVTIDTVKELVHTEWNEGTYVLSEEEMVKDGYTVYTNQDSLLLN